MSKDEREREREREREKEREKDREREKERKRDGERERGHTHTHSHTLTHTHTHSHTLTHTHTSRKWPNCVTKARRVAKNAEIEMPGWSGKAIYATAYRRFLFNESVGHTTGFIAAMIAKAKTTCS